MSRTTTIDADTIRFDHAMVGSGKKSYIELLRHEEGKVVQKVRIVADTATIYDLRRALNGLGETWKRDIAWALGEEEA